MQTRKFFVGVDVGGTFTDVVMAEESTHKLYTSKKLTTAEAPAEGVMEALSDAIAQAGCGFEAIDRAVHATTLATNLVLERKGSSVAFVTTEGFGDLLVIGQERRPDADRYDLFYDRPPPLVPRNRTIEVRERMSPDGEPIVALDKRQAEAEVRRLLASEKVEAFAVCLLHSYANRDHESQVAEIIRRCAPGVYVAVSSEVWPEYREYERATTTVMSAYVGTLMAGYVEGLERRLRASGMTGSFQIMQSNGGVMSSAATARRPIYSIESGPAAGVIAAAHLGERFGRRNIISFDMGGTTAKAGLVRDGKPAITNEFRVGGGASVGGRRSATGSPIRIPVIDLAEVGAGGGSIARVDAGNILQVGPESAGSSPGPACYGRGGDRPTVTDADLILGYLNPRYFLGGRMPIYAEKSREAMERHVAGPLAMDVVEAAAGVYEIVNANMASAIHMVTVQRGIDPREFTLVAFGGAGPTHVIPVAREFEISSVIIPITPGLTSALGLVMSDMMTDHVRTRVMDLERAEIDEVNAIYRELEQAGVSEMRREGLSSSLIRVERQADIRFKHQSHELPVPVGPGRLTSQDLEAASAAFRDLYHELYGIRQDAPTQLVNFKVKVTGSVPKAELATVEETGGDPARALKATRPVYFKASGGFTDTPVYERGKLLPVDTWEGPAVIEEPDSTIIVPPGYRATVDRYLSVIIEASR